HPRADDVRAALYIYRVRSTSSSSSMGVSPMPRNGGMGETPMLRREATRSRTLSQLFLFSHNRPRIACIDENTSTPTTHQHSPGKVPARGRCGVAGHIDQAIEDGAIQLLRRRAACQQPAPGRLARQRIWNFLKNLHLERFSQRWRVTLKP